MGAPLTVRTLALAVLCFEIARNRGCIEPGYYRERIIHDEKILYDGAQTSWHDCGHVMISGSWARSSMVEQLTLNQRVGGSSPPALTTNFLPL